MKKSIILPVLLAFFTINTQMYSQFSGELSGGLSIPQDSDSKSMFNQGLYGGLGLTYRIMNSLDIMTVLHYHRFTDTQENRFGSYTTTVNATIEYMPIMVGARYTFTEGGLQPFVSASIGSASGKAIIATVSNIVPNNTTEITETFGSVSIAGGVKMSINAQLSLLGMAEYTKLEKDTDKIEMLAIKVGLGFNL